MRSWKARWKDRPSLLRGRLHGRAFKALGALAVAALAIAVWQLAASLGGDDDVGSGGGELSDPLFSPMPDESPDAYSERATATPSGEASTTAEESTSESEESTEDAEPEPSAEDSTEAGSGCTAALHLDSEWGDSISVTVEVLNTGDEGFDGWEVLLALDDVDVTAVWGMEHIEGDRYGNGWINGDLEPGESAEPSFNGSVEDDYSLPATVPCSPA